MLSLFWWVTRLIFLNPGMFPSERGGVICRAVSTEEGEALAKELGVLFIEASAKCGYNVTALFNKVAANLTTGEKAKTEGEEGNKCRVWVDSAVIVSYQDQCRVEEGGCRSYRLCLLSV